MADQMNWAADGAPFSDLGSDLLNSTEFDTGAFGAVEGKLHFDTIFVCFNPLLLRETVGNACVVCYCFVTYYYWNLRYICYFLCGQATVKSHDLSEQMPARS